MKKTIRKSLCLLLCVLISLTVLAGCGNDSETDTTTDNNNANSSNVVSQSNITSGFTTEYTTTDVVEIDVRDYGVITVALDSTKAPITVENFISLVESGFYDGLTFHRIMKGFVIQGGDPNHNGSGGSDNTIKGEFTRNGVDNNLAHVRGAISMARSTLYDSASSQFFIVHEDSCESLDTRYACFGYVTDGMDIVDKICEDANPTDDNGTISTAQQPIINKITVKK